MEHATQKKNVLVKEVLMMEVAHLDMGFVVYVSTKNNLLGILNLKIYVPILLFFKFLLDVEQQFQKIILILYPVVVHLQEIVD